MKWTKSLPTIPGWYWYRGEYDAGFGHAGGFDSKNSVQPVIIFVDKGSGYNDTKLSGWQPFMDYDDPLTIDHFPGEWSGPIAPPDGS